MSRTLSDLLEALALLCFVALIFCLCLAAESTSFAASPLGVTHSGRPVLFSLTADQKS
jgi:hypothetical protein